MNVDTNSNYITNSIAAAKQFAKTTARRLHRNIEPTPWGQYKSAYGPMQVGDIPSIKTDPSAFVAATTLDALTNATRRNVWAATNMHRLVGSVGQKVAPKLGLGSVLAGATVAAAVPITVGALSGQIGSPLQGLRPKGEKAVAPVSLEKDPTGRTSQSPIIEASMRYLLGQHGQLLPYGEFKKERPDIAPSTYAQYKRYQHLKPEAGQLIRLDPQSQSITALGGVVRATARGLNDPEVRLKGVPVTASAAIGTAAGLGAIKGLSKLTEAKTYEPPVFPEGSTHVEKVAIAQKSIDDWQNRQLKGGELIGKQLGSYRDPLLLAAGAVTAVAASQVAKKLFQKAAERRIKKENPVEYLKHKHGSLEAAGAALNMPQARSWQELVPHVK